MFKKKTYKVEGLYHVTSSRVARIKGYVIARTKFGARKLAKKLFKQYHYEALIINKPIKEVKK